MSDLIYRDDALRELNGAFPTWEADSKAEGIIQGLPSVEVVPLMDYLKLKRQLTQLGYLLAEKIQAEKDGAKKSSDRKKIYIAGPVTGVEGYEKTFAKAADALRAKGYEPVNPVAPGLVEGYSYRDYINRGFDMLMDCDGMLLLPGYMDSKGAALELHYALAVGMEIMTLGAIK